MKYQTVLFDMDGTLLDTLTDMEAAVNHILTQYGYPVRTLEEVRRFVGNGAGLLIHRALPQGVDPAREAEVLAAYRAYYQAHNCIRTRPYEGIPELLAALRRAGVRTAVLSNKAHALAGPVVEDYYPGQFPWVQGALPGLPTKPDPTLLHRLMEQMGASPEDTLFVGDSDVDIRTARNGGLTSCGVLWGFRGRAELEAEGADCLARTPEELVKAVLGDG